MRTIVKRKSGKRKPLFKKIWTSLSDPKDTQTAWIIAFLILLAEAVLSLGIIYKVPYTEIDWEAYMQEVGGFLDGELNYRNLKGDTGPLVYPAGFVYLFSALRMLTGGAIFPAQLVYTVLYLGTQLVVMTLYISTASMPPWSLLLLCLSRRLHSLFLLRLFNDCWSMFFAYVATFALQKRQWIASIALYSLAVSVKMNVLLFAPGVLAVLMKETGIMKAIWGTFAGFGLQLALGAPFLLHHPVSYLERAFEFSRVFMYKWSVNWQFLPETIFLSKKFAILLLVIQFRLLWSLANYTWFKDVGGLYGAWQSFADLKKRNEKKASRDGQFEDDVLYIVFLSNYVGILCSRTLHYQFYCWYFHMLPFLLLRTRLSPVIAILVFLSIEVLWNIYPPTEYTSLLLLFLHVVVFITSWRFRKPYAHRKA